MSIISKPKDLTIGSNGKSGGLVPTLLCLVMDIKLRIKFFFTFRTYSMTELRIRVIRNVFFNLVPIPLVIADFLTRGAYGQKSLKGFNLAEGEFQFLISLPRSGCCLSISEYYRPIPEIDHWLRRRVRMCYWKQWRYVRTRVRNLLKIGAHPNVAIPMSFLVKACGNAPER